MLFWPGLKYFKICVNRKRQAKVQKELEDAAKESKATVVLPEDELSGHVADISLLSTLPVGCVVPTVASTKFVNPSNFSMPWIN